MKRPKERVSPVYVLRRRPEAIRHRSAKYVLGYIRSFCYQQRYARQCNLSARINFENGEPVVVEYEIGRVSPALRLLVHQTSIVI